MAIGFPVKDDYVTGDVLTAANMNDLSGTVNTLQSTGYAAGKNKIINGDFGVWQRGTTFTPAASAYVFSADRMAVSRDGTGATVTVSRQAFTPGTAPVTGYESQYFLRYAQTVAGTGGTYLTLCSQKIENVQTFANQSVTFSFWAKTDATRTVAVGYGQIFGSGGSSDVYGSLGSSITLTTSWVRYTVTGTIPSISGKTVGTGSFLELYISGVQNTTQTIDLWGLQLEAGSTASDFQTATGTLQGELAACQRYYRRLDGAGNATAALISGLAFSTTVAMFIFPFGIEMRIPPSALEVNNQGINRPANATAYSGGTWALNQAMNCSSRVIYTHGSAVFTAGESLITSSTTTSSYFAFSAEL